jgi:hypothetical protein
LACCSTIVLLPVIGCPGHLFDGPRIYESEAIERNSVPTPGVRLSIWLHTFAALALIAYPEWWRWLAGALAGNHLLLGAFGTWPRNRLIGVNRVTLPRSIALEREPAGGATRLLEISRTAIDAQHGAGQPVAAPPRADRGRNLHHVAERLARSQPQHIPMHRIATQFGREYPCANRPQAR